MTYQSSLITHKPSNDKITVDSKIRGYCPPQAMLARPQAMASSPWATQDSDRSCSLSQFIDLQLITTEYFDKLVFILIEQELGR